jgi:spore coat protein CotF
MPTLLGGILGNNSTMSDEVIANDMLAGTKSAAQAYLNATLESATPEVKKLYASTVSEMLTAHANLTDLAVKKRWYKPYEMPEQQLADAYKQSVSVTTQESR